MTSLEHEWLIMHNSHWLNTIDTLDTFPNNPGEVKDSDGDCEVLFGEGYDRSLPTSGDGCGDASDFEPENSAVQEICQSSLVSDLEKDAADCFPDSDEDGVSDPFDACPFDE